MAFMVHCIHNLYACIYTQTTVNVVLCIYTNYSKCSFVYIYMHINYVYIQMCSYYTFVPMVQPLK